MGRYLELAERAGKRLTEPPAARAEQADWRPGSLDAERRFGQPHAKLFPFIGRKVRTPAGPGTLLQVFAERVTVLLDSELSKCSVFEPGEIEPLSGEVFRGLGLKGLGLK